MGFAALNPSYVLRPALKCGIGLRLDVNGILWYAD